MSIYLQVSFFLFVYFYIGWLLTLKYIKIGYISEDSEIFKAFSGCMFFVLYPIFYSVIYISENEEKTFFMYDLAHKYLKKKKEKYGKY